LLGYFVLSRAPFPRQSAPRKGHKLLLICSWSRSETATSRVLFYGLWTFALGIAGPMYSVFMLQNLAISYREISVYNGLFTTSIVGYRLWAGLVERSAASRCCKS